MREGGCGLVEGLMGTPSFFKKARKVSKPSSLLCLGSIVIVTRRFELGEPLLGVDFIAGLHVKDCDLIGCSSSIQHQGSILETWSETS